MPAVFVVGEQLAKILDKLFADYTNVENKKGTNKTKCKKKRKRK